ncbi:MAG: peptidoglycan DD-metalloendopeptidase family protein [Candidatus Altiarchaeales archaeon]|nr:peptidoglycan DD-metalloendopeptidase family protein [Candidatus Altiarchaeales archaeon]MBD3415760.1 peptidoglycan DD-metalloendopeptidase family protein [Candidatus Altiarchaeales archaeon]
MKGWSGRAVLIASLLLILHSQTVSARLCTSAQEENDAFNDKCCHYCRDTYEMDWPVDSTQAPEGALLSLCVSGEGEVQDGHFGFDMYAADGDPVYAAFDGTVKWFNETDESGFDYYLGCAIELESLDGKYTAFYGHLQSRSAEHDEVVKMGQVIGTAGGGQEDDYCRGSSPGPRLYFELRDDEYRMIDPNTCVPNTCEYWYVDEDTGEDCVPKVGYEECHPYPNTVQGDYRWPSYSCGYEDSEELYYAEVLVDDKGRLVLDCYEEDGEDICYSEVYDKNLDPLIAGGAPKDLLNCFLRFIRVKNNGEYTCGKIDGDSIDWGADPNCEDLVSAGVATRVRTKHVNYRRLPLLTDPKESTFGDYVLVGGEYQVLGVDDSDYINKLRVFNEEEYHTDYILSRICDSMGETRARGRCKTFNLGPYQKIEETYSELIGIGGFGNCTYAMRDEGKFYDEPGTYISAFEVSRFGANKGLEYYQLMRPSQHIYEIETVGMGLMWWNDDTIERIWGCDNCWSGFSTCSLGSAIASIHYNAGNPFDPTPIAKCGYWEKQADYYGYLDLDDDAAADNPAYHRQDGIYDEKYDFENGLPDETVVQKAVESIITNVTAYFVREIEWKQPPFWMHLYNPGPGGAWTDWEVWIMPCADQSCVEYYCRWATCNRRETLPCPCPNCPPDNTCEVGGVEVTCNVGPAGCDMGEGWVSYDPPEQCQQMFENGDNIDMGGWQCTPYTSDHSQSVASQGYCGYGGVRVVWDENKSAGYNYSHYPPTHFHGRNCNDQLEKYGYVHGAGFFDEYAEYTGTMPGVFPDGDTVRDRYWKRNDSIDEDFYCSRPGYCAFETSSGGECPQAETRDEWDRPGSKRHDPCLACNKHTVCPDLCFNYDLMYYRQFNVDSVWAKVFKIVPELSFLTTDVGYPEDMEPNCAYTLPGRYDCGLLNVHEGPCREDEDCIQGLKCVESYEGGSKFCCPAGTHYIDDCCRFEENELCYQDIEECPEEARGKWLEGMGGVCQTSSDCAHYRIPPEDPQIKYLHCSANNITAHAKGIDRFQEGHCCPSETEWDLTHECCLPTGEAVRFVEMYDTIGVKDQSSGGIEERTWCWMKHDETGQWCEEEEGPCEDDDECLPDTDLICTGNIHSSTPPSSETACCKENWTWTGRDCKPKDVEDQEEWSQTWTRSGDEPVWIYSGAGFMIPNCSEAAGWEATCRGQDSWYEDDRWLFSGGGKPPDGCATGKGPEYCTYCVASEPYRCPESPIWFEARNFGDQYQYGEPLPVCNGDFWGIDATVKPYKSFLNGPDGRTLECISEECNCGRAMRGDWDKEDGIKGCDMAGGGEVDGGCMGCMPGTCNSMEPTTCKRSDVSGGAHQCNVVMSGHGGFTGGKVVDGMPVDPYAVDAAAHIPKSCGRMQRKEVHTYPRNPGQEPFAQMDIMVTEYDENHGVVDVQSFSKAKTSNKLYGKDNLLTEKPPAPASVMHEDKQEVQLSPETRYLNVGLKYSVINEMKRELLVKQCGWQGCSRLEEKVISYRWEQWEEIIVNDITCETEWFVTHNEVYAGDFTPPCCCRGNQPRTPYTQDPIPFQWDNDNPPAHSWCECTYWTTCNGVPIELECYYYHDCRCDYTCWGCWHHDSVNLADYLVTKDKGPCEWEIVYEKMKDYSRIWADDYGDHLRVENPIDSGNSEAVIKVNGTIQHGHEDSSNENWAFAYLNFKAVDEESTRSPGRFVYDLFDGFTLTIEDAYEQYLMMDFTPKKYYPWHDGTALQSTLPQDWKEVTEENARLLDLAKECYKTRLTPPGQEIDLEYETSDPLYVRWTYNPSKKSHFFIDQFSAYGSQYTWKHPLWLVDKGRAECYNYIYEISSNIGLLRNFHEDEPHYYDFAALYWRMQDVERGLDDDNWRVDEWTNVRFLKKSKPIGKAYVRYALYCDSEEWRDVDYQCSSIQDCPPMCNQIADLVCEGGRCDCEYKEEFENLYPIDNETCKDLNKWVLSGLVPCEGVPSKYRNHCAEEEFKAYWLDHFQFRYKWNFGESKCNIEYLKECEPKGIAPQSYTLILDSNSLTEYELGFTDIEVYTPFQSQDFPAFGDAPICPDGAQHGAGSGGLTVRVNKPPPEEFYLESDFNENSRIIKVWPAVLNVCTNQSSEDGYDPYCKHFYIQFQHPYIEYTGWYDLNEEIMFPVDRLITAVITCHDDHGFKRSVPFVDTVPVDKPPEFCDYLMDNLWVLLIAFAAVMSYRFFSGKALDFAKARDEFDGKA